MILSQEARDSFLNAKAIHNLNTGEEEAIAMLTISVKEGASADDLVNEFKGML